MDEYKDKRRGSISKTTVITETLCFNDRLSVHLGTVATVMMLQRGFRGELGALNMAGGAWVQFPVMEKRIITKEESVHLLLGLCWYLFGRCDAMKRSEPG